VVPENKPFDTEMQITNNWKLRALSGPSNRSGALIVITTLDVWDIISVNYN